MRKGGDDPYGILCEEAEEGHVNIGRLLEEESCLRWHPGLPRSSRPLRPWDLAAGRLRDAADHSSQPLPPLPPHSSGITRSPWKGGWGCKVAERETRRGRGSSCSPGRVSGWRSEMVSSV